jgi:Raf kinase inhibitor-like YbhB/YbcL family protein
VRRSGWRHWIVYDIPATATGLSRKADDPGSPGIPKGAKQVRPDGDVPEPHYYGPCPDEGDPPHRYTITVYALSVDHLNVSPSVSCKPVRELRNRVTSSEIKAPRRFSNYLISLDVLLGQFGN